MTTDNLARAIDHETLQANAPLELRNLNKTYSSGVQANRSINLTMATGEMLGILGPNGAGKTTLIRQITTELIPTSGTVTILGHDAIAEPTKVKTLLGIVPQEAILLDHLTVFQHLRIFAKLRGSPGRAGKQRAEELVVELHMEEYRNAPIRTLSGGLKRRVLVGIAALAQPPLMVLDEPTTGLDPQSRQELWALLRRYRESGTAVIITTHYMEEAEALCDRVAIIVNGQLVALDTVANLLIEHDYKFKITYYSKKDTRDPITLYGSSEQELVELVRARGEDQFVLSNANLEDLYLALTSSEKAVVNESNDKTA